MAGRKLDVKSEGGHGGDNVVRRFISLRKSTWDKIGVMRKRTGRTDADVFGPLVDETYRKWLQEEMKRLHVK
jgi:hypothetical protein